MWHVIVLVILSLMIGGLTGRWWTVPIPSVMVAGFYLGLLAGWWGNGVGDAWYAPMVFGFLVATISVCAGIAARRGLTSD